VTKEGGNVPIILLVDADDDNIGELGRDLVNENFLRTCGAHRMKAGSGRNWGRASRIDAEGRMFKKLKKVGGTLKKRRLSEQTSS